ncbi:MAG: enoyl-CoA hydratase/isomerase [Bacteroidota bacterium]|jgi:enoyl-CoA hydratase
MNYKNIIIENKEGIVVLTISREKAMNALNQQTMSELEQFFSKDAASIQGLRGVIITGAGEKAFVAGADISEFTAFANDDTSPYAKRGQDIFFLIENFTKPVIAAVNGFALGGGCELAMACHLRMASENAKFGLPEVGLGIIPAYGGTQRLVQLIGKGRALEMMMTGDMIDAHTALQFGLVNHLVARGEAVTKAKTILTKIIQKAPLAISVVIEAANAVFNEKVNGFEKESKSFGKLTKTDDFKEGAKAFLEKRKATFTGQ